jgi:pimeloyl-ACP methyl ester carboxylesterase
VSTTFTLQDGRELEYEVVGPDDALTVVFQHGTPGCTVMAQHIQRPILQAGLRLVSYSRPGFGLSTRQPGRCMGDAAQDVRQLLDHLGADTCISAGWSGGGPSALAVAALLPQRVVCTLVMSSIAPFDAPDLVWTEGMGEQNADELLIALEGEDAIRPIIEDEAAQYVDPDLDTVLRMMSTLLPGVDRAVLDEEFGRFMVANMIGCTLTGADGWVDDALAAVQPWGFSVEQITGPVFLWHGDSDLMVPFGHGVWLANNIPNVTEHLLLREGHLSLSAHHAETMIAEVVASLGSP